MIPGPYCLCLATLPDDQTEVPDLHTLVYGYDFASQAFSACDKVAKEEGHPVEDIVVIRWIDPEETDRFND